MTDLDTKPTPVVLPPELWSYIIPDPAIVHGFCEKDIQVDSHREQRWLAIKQEWVIDHRTRSLFEPAGVHDVKREETVALLRALAQTCRAARAFAIPLLWAVVDVRTVSELGRIRETFRVSPYLARYVRSFFWLWDMGGDSLKMDGYSKKEGSLLSMAFRDRLQMYAKEKSKNQQARCQVSDRGTVFAESYFFDENGRKFSKPGWAEKNKNSRSPKAEREAYRDVTYTRHRGGIGPDGKSRDRLIKDEADLESCMVEIVAQLSSLCRFGWESSVHAMPRGVATALIKAEHFRALHVRLTLPRQGLHVVPYWELGHRLRYLSLSLVGNDDSRPINNTQERFVDQLCAFELPAQADESAAAAMATYASIANRTIIAAVNNGRKLRDLSLYSPCHSLDVAFACKQLLPKWATIDSWNLAYYNNAWAEAARSLRPALAHASFWRAPSSNPLVKNDRLLTGKDVQALRFRFANEGMPDFLAVSCSLPSRHNRQPPIDLYFAWLEEDAELAQRVADEWNVDVEKGYAQSFKCWCRKCQGRLKDLAPCR